MSYWFDMDGSGTRGAEVLAQPRANAQHRGSKQVVVHLDAQTLRERTQGRCEIEQGTTLAVETARRLSCDASLVKMLENSQGDTAATLWRGERLDYGLAIHVLLQHAARSQNVCAETSEKIF